MNKKSLSERDICSQFINPALLKAGWDFRKQVRKEIRFIDGHKKLINNNKLNCDTHMQRLVFPENNSLE